MKRDIAKDTLIVIKSIESEGFLGDAGIVAYVPPLGTINAYGDRTVEDSNAVISPGIDKVSMPAKGKFELILGKTSLEFKDEPEKNDSADFQHPADQVRGWDKLSGTISLENPRGNERFSGAIMGAWDPDKLYYSQFKDFREFEIWVLKGADVMDLTATKARTLIKHYFVKLDSGGEKFENPIKMSVPLTRRWTTRHINWTDPGSAQLLVPETGVTPVPLIANQVLEVGDILQPREHTRLDIVPTGHTGTHYLKITGRNIVQEHIEEIVKVVGNNRTQTRKYFDFVTTVESVDFVGSIVVKDYDYSLNPA